MGLRHACRSTESLRKRSLFMLDNMAVVLGCREICVISLATFTIPVCRWIASETHPADEHLVQSVTVQECILMLINVGTSATGLTSDSELFTVLSAEAARVAGEEAQSRKLARVRSCTGVADTSQGRTDTYPKTTRRRRTCTAPPLRRVVFPRAEPSRRNHGSVLRSHKGRVEVVGKAGRDGGGKLQARSENCLMTTNEFVKWNQNVSDLPRPVQTLQVLGTLSQR